MEDNLFINAKAVLFHESLDRQNDYHTIICNPKTQNYLKVNPNGYKILRTIEENPGITLNEISAMIEMEEGIVEKFILTMIKENVVLTK